MIVGVLRVELRLEGVRSLKEKRMRIRPILDRLRGRYNAAVAEVGGQDDWHRAVLGAAVVSTDKAHASQMLEPLAAGMEREGRVVSRSTEYMHPRAHVSGDDHDGPALGRWDDFDE